MKDELITEDFYYNEEGYLVFTEKYHLERGYCCGNGCLHCPYDYINVPEPERNKLKGRKPVNNQSGSAGLNQ